MDVNKRVELWPAAREVVEQFTSYQQSISVTTIV